MANDLHNILIDKLVTKQDLIDQDFKIEKHKVMIDSRAYTEDAFEYILKLADIAGAIVFVYDTKKIWANGRYFGGDIFEEDLKYFTHLHAMNNLGEITGGTSAKGALSNLFIQGKSHLDVKAIQNDDDPYFKNVLEFNYKLNDAVNTDYVTIGGSRYNLVVENDQIRLNEYIPMKVTCSSLPVLEYDSVEVNASVSFKITASGSMPNIDDVKIAITCDNDDVEISQNESIVNATIPRNTNVTFTIKYEDGITFGETKVTQKWGYGVWVGYFDGNGFAYPQNSSLEWLTNFNGDGLDTMTKYLWVPSSSSINILQKINQNNTSWGLFIGPSHFDYEFVDTSTNLTGGWTPLYDNIGELYEDKINYIPYITDHKGLGLVEWKIKG